MLVKNGYWNLSNISMVWPPSILLMIKATPTKKVPIDKDKLSWISSANGSFDPKNAYKLANLDSENFPGFNGNWIWKSPILP